MLTIPFASQGQRLLAVFAALVLALGGCGGDPAPAKPAAGGGADTFQAPDVGSPDPAPVAQSVGAAGGAVKHSSGAKLQLPPGALPADVELTVQAAAPPASVAEVGTPVGPALILGPEGQTFLVPVQIGVPVDPAMTKGLDPADLQLVIAPSAGGEFVGLETTYDAASKQLIAETSHFSIVVPVKRKGPALKLTLPSPLPTAKVGAAYGPVVLQASGGKPPFSWSLVGGNLAPGLAFSPDGKLSGTPDQAGSFAASVRVKDSAGQVLEKALALSVDGPPNAKPVLDAVAPASAKAGSGELAIAATGQGFAIGALLTIDGKGVPTVRVSASELKAKLTAAQLASPGVLAIAAVNPPPGGGAGPSVEFVVTAADGDVVAGEDAVDAADGADGEDAPDTQDVQEDTGGDAVDAGADASPACVPSAELCDGKDNDCNGQTDDNPCCTLAAGAACDDGSVCTTGEKCTDGLCLGGDVTVCVDDNLCTDNTCDPKLGCNFPANAAPCNDDKACTQGDTCQGKACAPGLSPLCDDGNACTLDQCSETAGCSHLPLDGGCDDGNGCTVGEVCKDGACGGAEPKSCDDGNPCSLDQCDKATGKCSAQVVAGCGDPCKDASDCKDDGNPCTLADCVTGACAVVASGGGCDDGDACTSGDSCTGGICLGAVATCDDGNACTNDACGKDGKCSSSPAVGGCEDGNACTVLEACKAGVCVPGGAANCEDGNACTDDSCDPKSGCQHPDSATPCTDDNPCSIGDACKGGKCTASGPKDCDDGDACTADACDSKDGLCSSKPIAGCGDFCNVAGDCLDDKNPCTEWECATGKCAVLYPTIGCDDGSACTVEDTCAKGGCAGSTKVCDDANVCSDDSCDKASGCVYLPNAASCTDGQVCTVGDQCKDKGCVPGKAADCDDFNECTFDTCDSKLGCTHSAEGLTCSDDDPCTVGDACVGSSCVGGKAKTCDDSNACTLDVCDPGTGKCGFSGIAGCGAPCGGDGDCPAGPGPCLALSCQGGVCAASETTATCDDGSVCTAKDACAKGQCLGSSADCDDGNGCTADTCNPKTGCAHQAITGPCEDGDLCTVQDFCIEGPSCKAGLPQQCADGNPCTADACDPKKGCQFAGIQAACNDGDPCTLGDACAKGECLPGDPSPCDDGNGCTADACDSQAGNCVQAAIKGCGAACQGDGDCQDDGNPCTAQVCSEGKCAVQAQSGGCDDGNPCTSQDACAKSACGGAPKVCDDGNPCTTDGCDPKLGCTYSANTAPCALGNACNAKDQCKDKVCTPGAPVSCDDGNSCTLDTCDPDSGCQNTATSAPCDDGSLCTVADECDQGVCLGGSNLPCDDGSACTADTCDNASGKCVFTALKGCGEACAASKDCPDDGNPCTESVCAASACVIVFAAVACDDGDPCSAADTCNDGKCQGSEDACDDGNACTADSCDAKTGCSSSAKAGPCDDGSACTSGDLCDKGACKGAKLLNCDDGNPCTTDACDPGLGCASVDNKAACSDGNPCTADDKCAKGQCEPGDVKACDDGKPCTLDVCELVSGNCKSTAVAGCGGNCASASDCQADSDPCTDAVCTEGVCALALNTTACDDGNACTGGDACDKGLCIGGPKDCGDDNSCTLDSCDAKSGCVLTPIAGACDDGNACTSGEACGQGKCAGGKPVSCVDANTCTDDSCDPTKGCVQLPNKVTCDDDNLCTSVDKCLQTYCVGAAEKDCDDKNPCTQDSCSTVKGCVYSSNSAVCDDGNACTEGDSCAQSKCAGGKPTNCDDGSSCTTDSCDLATGCTNTASSGDCEDGNACTAGDLCVFGSCLPGQPKDCNDSNPCTDDACSEAKGCVNAANKAACDDGDACTVGDVCGSSKCAPGTPADCDDKNPCTDDSCSKTTGCKNAANTKPCSDGDACTTSDVCENTQCIGGVAPDCDDKNPCTANSCDKNKGCVVLALDITCTDGDACTTGDTCKGGDCAPGAKVVCDDQNVCTDDSCDKSKGCVALPNTASCTDGSVCTAKDACKDGTCLPGAATDCDDANPCSDDACDKVKGCSNLPNTKPCSDGDACTENDVCAGGVCVTKPVNCDDGKVCTFDSCDAKTGCSNTELGGACSDGDACTGLDLCSGGNCQPGAAVQCDDKNPCTDDSCDKQKGCVNAANTKPCDDGDVCTLGDGCAGGACKSSGSKDCDDKNLCTDDSCDKVKGCVNLANTVTCTDGDACTSGDACKEGACMPGKVASCDDGNACTDDSCDKTAGCKAAANTAPCDDKDACTTADQCASGTCSGTTIACDDGNACTDDSCDKAVGCKNTANSATNCTDGNACTKDDACAQGKCAGTPLTCNDNVACTVDSCAPATGCKYAANNNLCNDNESCTTESCDAVAGCKKTTAGDNSGCTTSDPCVTQAVCLSGKCSQKPKVSVKNMAQIHPTALMSQGDTSWVVTSTDPQGYFHVQRLDADLNTEFDVKFQGAGGDARKFNGDIWGGGYYDSGLVVSNVTHDGNPVHNRMRRLHQGNGSEQWNKQLPGPMKRIGIDGGGIGALAHTGVTQTNQIHFFDTSGNLQYSYTLPAHGDHLVYDEQYDGTYIVCGHVLESAGSWNWKPWVAKVRRNGYLEIKWQKTLGSSFGDGKAAYACAYDGSGGAFVYSNEGSGSDSAVMRRFDKNGNEQWAKTKMAADANHETAGHTLVEGGPGVVAVGKQDGTFGLAAGFGADGSSKWSKVIPNYDVGLQITSASMGSSLMVGGWYNNIGKGTPAFAFVMKVNQDGTVGDPVCTAQNLCTGKTCNDNVACTIDSCDPKTGCVYTPDVTQCDDGNICTANSCDAVKGCTYAASTAGCDDKNPCTTDTCDSIGGCTNTANADPCDDANACTVGDTCGGKACIGGGAKSCEDGIACTAHSCDSKTGCKQTANHANCDDGKQCTADTCDVAKGCTYAADTKLCDDANVCTDDSCDNAKGCTNAANVALCDDGNACTTADGCVGGVCKGGKSLACDDLKECTTDSCDPAVGCKVVNKANNASCTPSTSCSATATCGGDGNCYDGPSKYWKQYLDNTKGGPWGRASMTPVYDGGGGAVFTTQADCCSGGIRRVNDFGQTMWEHQVSARSLNVAKCTFWDPKSLCITAGRNGSNGQAEAERRNAGTGNLEATWSFNFGSADSRFVDVAFENGAQAQPFLAAYRTVGGKADAYVARWGQGKTWFYEGPENDMPTALAFDKYGTLVVGYSNSKGGSGYDGFWQREGYNGGVNFYGGAGDEYFYDVVNIAGSYWAVGTGSDSPGGQNYGLLVRIEGGAQVVKKITSLNGIAGAATDGSKLFVTNGGKIAALDASQNPLWENSYPLSPLNLGLSAIATHPSGLWAGGHGFNGQNGMTGIALIRSDWDGILNCTDKNPCASLTPGQCDDKVACTYDACDVKSGCTHTPDNGQCNDGNPCTQNSCDEVKGCLYPDATGKPCDDGKPCTLDVCDKAAAKCTSTFDPAKACSDGDLCTNELCDGNNKCAWATNDCNDGKQCTADSCDPAKGCSHAAKTGACDDGNLCTVADSCEGGTCKGAEVCKPPVTNGLVFTADAGLASTLIFNGSYLNWFDASVASTGSPLLPNGQYAKSLSGGGFYKPKLVTNAIMGRPAVELYHTGLSFNWQNKGELTFAVVWKDLLPSNLNGEVLKIGNLLLVTKQGQLILYQAGSQNSIKVSVTAGSSYLLVVRLRSSEVKMALYGSGSKPLFASMLSTPLSSGNELMKIGTSQDQVNSELQLGAFTLFDRALTDSEFAKLAAELRSDWNFPSCQSDGDCDDGNGCTGDKCEADIDGKVCTYSPFSSAKDANVDCDDANACTDKHKCDNGVCSGTGVKVCDDNNVCTVDTCDTFSGACKSAPDNSLKCDDGNACTFDVCNSGNCQGLPNGCDDKNLCTDDSCDPKIGCVFVANSAPCNDNAVCTGPDVCKDKACSTPFNTAPCDDLNPCTVNDACKDGDCLSGAPKVCPSDGDVCTKDECSVYVGCKYTSTSAACDDKNPCTDDTCDSVKGCSNTANLVACSDGELCTVGDFCAAKKCNPGKLNECEDGNICTTDSCVSGAGCKNEVVTTCEDGNLCTVDDLCVFGSCISGGAKNCDDANACTTDYCIAPGGGCGHDPLVDGAPCDDGELCTLPDTCQAGSCKVGPKVCDYAVTSLADTEEVDPFSGKPFATAGTLRAALVKAEDSQWVQSGKGQATGTRVLRFFIGGKLTLAKPLPAVFFDKSIDSGPQTVLLDGNGATQALYIHSGTTTIKGLKFQNFFVDKSTVSPPVWPTTSGNGGAITVMSPTNAAVPTKLILDACEFYNAKAQYGGGAIYAVDAEIEVKGGNFVKCSRTTGTGATLPNGSIVYADGGGAVRIEGSKAKFTASDLRFDYNSGPGPGSGLWCGPGSSCVLNRVSFFGGLAHSGAVGVAAGASASLTNVTIVANEGYGIGTGLYSQGNLTLRHVTISGNSAANQQTMPALYVNGPTVMENTIVSEAGGSATGLDCVRGPKGTVTVLKSIISNTAAMPDDWGSDGGGKACAAVTQPPANLKGQKLVGNVRVMYPYPGSPAVDKAHLGACLSPTVGAVDAAGAARPKGNGCDIGSAELQP